ncbi:MAG: hypothetical protein Q8Q33_04360, partial [Chlamydiota bacterium]|nr:hypothetical protein [Chlamydiota bacterium]
VDRGLEMVSEAVQQVKEISMATGQQKTAAEQVVIAMKNIDQVARQFATLTKQNTSAASQLHQQAEKMLRTFEEFKLNPEALEHGE